MEGKEAEWSEEEAELPCRARDNLSPPHRQLWGCKALQNFLELGWDSRAYIFLHFITHWMWAALGRGVTLGKGIFVAQAITEAFEDCLLTELSAAGAVSPSLKTSWQDFAGSTTYMFGLESVIHLEFIFVYDMR